MVNQFFDSKFRIIGPQPDRFLTAAAATGSSLYRVVSALDGTHGPGNPSWTSDIRGKWTIRPVNPPAESPVMLIFTPDGKGAESEIVMTMAEDRDLPALLLKEAMSPKWKGQQWTLDLQEPDGPVPVARIVNVLDPKRAVTTDLLVPLIFPPPDMRVNTAEKGMTVDTQLFRFEKIQ